MLRWGRRNVGVVFQFFQLLPTLVVLESLMLPVHYTGPYRRQRRPRALELLELVEIPEISAK